MKFQDILNFFRAGKKKDPLSLASELDSIFKNESSRLISLDRGYYESVSDRIKEYNSRILSVKYEKELGRLRVVYPTFYIDFATVDIRLVDLLALFGLGIPILDLKISENSMKLIGELNEYSYEIEIFGVNVGYDVENLS